MPERRCAICGKPAAPRGNDPKAKGGRGPWPFCSERCRQVDLGRWFTESYAVPAGNTDDGENPLG